jgi:hypothetical protein
LLSQNQGLGNGVFVSVELFAELFELLGEDTPPWLEPGSARLVLLAPEVDWSLVLPVPP